MKILHPPLYPLPSREGSNGGEASLPSKEGRQKVDHTLLPSPLVGEGKGEGSFRSKYYIRHLFTINPNSEIQ
jgi:hypothetical protein